MPTGQIGFMKKEQRIEKQILDSYEAMYRLAYSYMHNEEDALDVVQESAYKAIRYAGQLKEPEHIKTWLWKIVINTACTCLKEKKNMISLSEVQEEISEDTYQNFDVYAALGNLEERERTIIILRYFEDRKLSEIAEILGENLNTVKSLLYRGLKKLKLEIDKGDFSYES